MSHTFVWLVDDPSVCACCSSYSVLASHIRAEAMQRLQNGQGAASQCMSLSVSRLCRVCVAVSSVSLYSPVNLPLSAYRPSVAPVFFNEHMPPPIRAQTLAYVHPLTTHVPSFRHPRYNTRPWSFCSHALGGDYPPRARNTRGWLKLLRRTIQG